MIRGCGVNPGKVMVQKKIFSSTVSFSEKDDIIIGTAGMISVSEKNDVIIRTAGLMPVQIFLAGTVSDGEGKIIK